MRFPVKYNVGIVNFTQGFIGVSTNGGTYHGMLINVMVLEDFKCPFGKGASKSPMNDGFYKGSVTAFCSVLECKCSPGI